MRRAALRLSAAAVAVAAILAGGSWAPPPARAVPQVAAAVFPPSPCADTLGAAPVIDTTSDGSPIVVQTRPGVPPVPVILVHGWTGRSVHDASRTGAFSAPIDLFADGGAGDDPVELPYSLVGALQRTPGLAVYTFDYHRFSNRWVTDAEIAPRLAAAVKCVTDFYGTEAVIIAHSMGGLATRQALSLPSGSGPDIVDRVHAVVTFGTPNTGSDVAATVAAAIPSMSTPAWLILQVCGLSSTIDTDAGGLPCSLLPDAARGFASAAGTALRTGSPELAALPEWPQPVDVTAIAGSSRLIGLSMFGRGSTDAAGVDVGDVVVGVGSATAGSDDRRILSCAFRLSAVDHGLGMLLRAVGLESSASGAGSAVDLVTTNPCFHGNLMRTLNAVTAALAVVREAADRPSVIRGVVPQYDPATDGPEIVLPSNGPWPVDRSDGWPAFMMMLGVNSVDPNGARIGFPDWVSCANRDLCVVGSEGVGAVFRRGWSWKPSPVFALGDDPVATLRAAGLTDGEIWLTLNE